jgi:hypothetical protein
MKEIISEENGKKVKWEDKELYKLHTSIKCVIDSILNELEADPSIRSMDFYLGYQVNIIKTPKLRAIEIMIDKEYKRGSKC